MDPETNNPHEELEERLRFETLIADLSSKFINLPPGEVDREIMDAQRRICELLGLDFSALWQWSNEPPGFFKLTHFYSAREGPHPTERMHQDHYPWAREQLLAGRTIKVVSLQDLPPEAACDQATLRQFGIKSNLALPLAVGGDSPLGIVGLGTMRAERDWPDALVQRLQLVAQIFANALARKRSDQALRESEARLAAGTELAGLGYYEVDYAQRTCFLDDRFREICGLPPHVRQGLEPVQFWMDHVHPDDRQLLSSEREKLHGGEVDRIFAEYRYLHPVNGQRWLHHSARFAGRTAAGGGIRTYGVVRDITATKQAEEEMQRLRLQLWHVDRVAQTGAITASLAHELNQPLTGILSTAQAGLRFMAGGNPDPREIHDILTNIVHDTKRAGAVINGLRAMLRRKETQREPIILADIIQDTLDLLHSEMVGRQVECRLHLGPDSPVLADKAQIQQVLLNLVMNALEAMQDQPADQRRLELTLTRTDTGEAQVALRDSGPGVPQPQQEKLFEAFWTTKQQGLGIGLPISRSIIESHGGRLWFANNPDQGATFFFALPLTAH